MFDVVILLLLLSPSREWREMVVRDDGHAGGPKDMIMSLWPGFILVVAFFGTGTGDKYEQRTNAVKSVGIILML